MVRWCFLAIRTQARSLCPFTFHYGSLWQSQDLPPDADLVQGTEGFITLQSQCLSLWVMRNQPDHLSRSGPDHQHYFPLYLTHGVFIAWDLGPQLGFHVSAAQGHGLLTLGKGDKEEVSRT